MRLRWLTIVLMGVGLLTACAQPEPTPHPTPTSAPGPTATSVPTPTSALAPAPTPGPTATPTLTPTVPPTPPPTPTPTTTPTSTPLPTLTPTATPEPLALTFESRLEPRAIPGSPPDSIPYLVRVAGYNVEDEPLRGLFETPTMSWGRAAAYPGRVVVYVSRSRPESAITVSLSLPDGRRAEATFEHTLAMPAPCPVVTATSTPLCISFLRRDAPRSVPGANPWIPSPLIPNVFAVTGTDVTDIKDLRTAFEHRGFTWDTRITSDGQELIVYMHPSYPSGTHFVRLTLSDGRRAEAAFQHVATEPLPPLPEGAYADFPNAVQPLLNQLPVVDGLHLYAQLGGCPSVRTWNPGRECIDTGGALGTNSANYIDDSREVLLRLLPSDYAREYGTYAVTRTLAHEICHAHQHRMVIEAGLGDTTVRLLPPQLLWHETPEGEAFFEATGWRREGDGFSGAEDEPEGYQVPRWNPSFPAHEDFAEVCAYWYMDRDKLRETAPRRFEFAEGWLHQWVPDPHRVPFTVEFSRQQSTDLPDWFRSDLIYYVFTAGYDLFLLDDEVRDAAIRHPGEDFQCCDAGQVIYVGMRPSSPSGTYQISITLPDGRYTETSFEHTADTSTSVPP